MRPLDDLMIMHSGGRRIVLIVLAIADEPVHIVVVAVFLELLVLELSWMPLLLVTLLVDGDCGGGDLRESIAQHIPMSRWVDGHLL